MRERKNELNEQSIFLSNKFISIKEYNNIHNNKIHFKVIDIFKFISIDSNQTSKKLIRVLDFIRLSIFKAKTHQKRGVFKKDSK